MAEMKSFDLDAASIVSGAPHPIIVAKVPWDHFRAIKVRAGYAASVGEGRNIVVLVSKDTDGAWHTETTVKSLWIDVLGERAIDDLPWGKMTFHALCLPWEAPWAPDVGPPHQ